MVEGFWVSNYSREKSVNVTTQNTESNAVILLHRRAEKEQAWGDEELL